MHYGQFMIMALAYHDPFEKRLVRGCLPPVQQSGTGEDPRPNANSQDVFCTRCLFLEEFQE